MVAPQLKHPVVCSLPFITATGAPHDGQGALMRKKVFQTWKATKSRSGVPIASRNREFVTAKKMLPRGEKKRSPNTATDTRDDTRPLLSGPPPPGS